MLIDWRERDVRALPVTFRGIHAVFFGCDDFDFTHRSGVTNVGIFFLPFRKNEAFFYCVFFGF
tara:strand:- start:1236 stop:1424 length:189 start_codon:yes stop_codon:yes gene_type:complete